MCVKQQLVPYPSWAVRWLTFAAAVSGDDRALCPFARPPHLSSMALSGPVAAPRQTPRPATHSTAPHRGRTALPGPHGLPMASAAAGFLAVADGLSPLSALAPRGRAGRFPRPAPRVHVRVGRQKLPPHGRRVGQPNGALRAARLQHGLRRGQENQEPQALRVGGHAGPSAGRDPAADPHARTRWGARDVASAAPVFPVVAQTVSGRWLLRRRFRRLGPATPPEAVGGNGQAHGRPDRLRRAAAALDPQAHLSLAGAAAPPRARLRTHRSECHRLGSRHHDTAYAPSLGLIHQRSCVFR